MKALDKIIVVQYEDGELSEHWCKENRTDNISVEYIRKDALLEWLENKIKIPDVSFINGLTYLAYQDVIEHINEM